MGKVSVQRISAQTQRKKSVIARLKRRMVAYRARNQEQEMQQQERDKVQQQQTSVGFNLFCLEISNKIAPQSQEFFTNSTAASPLQGFPLSSVPTTSPLCWMCGEIHPTGASLNQHAIDVHFPEWLSSFIVWGTYLSHWFRCPQCGFCSSASDLFQFHRHVLEVHEEIVISWLEQNGFLSID